MKNKQEFYMKQALSVEVIIKEDNRIFKIKLELSKLNSYI